MSCIIFWSKKSYPWLLYIFLPTGGTGPIMGDLWALKGITEEGISSYLLFKGFKDLNWWVHEQNS